VALSYLYKSHNSRSRSFNAIICNSKPDLVTNRFLSAKKLSLLRARERCISNACDCEKISQRNARYLIILVLARLLRSCPMIASDRSPGRRIIDRLRSRVTDSDVTCWRCLAKKCWQKIPTNNGEIIYTAPGLFGGAFRTPENVRDPRNNFKARSPCVSIPWSRDHKMGKGTPLVSVSNNWKSNATSKRPRSRNQSADSSSSCRSNSSLVSSDSSARKFNDFAVFLSLSFFFSRDGVSRFAKWRNDIVAPRCLSAPMNMPDAFSNAGQIKKLAIEIRAHRLVLPRHPLPLAALARNRYRPIAALYVAKVRGASDHEVARTWPWRLLIKITQWDGM